MNNSLIIDVGMHTGRDTEFYLKKGFNVVAIEANPELVKKAYPVNLLCRVLGVSHSGILAGRFLHNS